MTEDTVEMDELNSHECMAKMSALLKHLVQNNISPEQPKVFVLFTVVKTFSAFLRFLNFAAVLLTTL